MRTIVGTRRLVQDDGLETYLEWIVRATSIAEDVMHEFAVPDWTEEVHRRKFQWAGQVARYTDGRWTRDVLLWSVTGARKRGRPVTRWTDSLNKFFKEESQSNTFWLALAEDEDSWNSLQDDYVNFVLGK